MQLLWHGAPCSGDRSAYLLYTHTCTQIKCQDSNRVTKTVHLKNDLLHHGPSKNHQGQRDIITGAALWLPVTQRLWTAAPPHHLQKAMENKDLSTNWEHVWMPRLIHSSWRKSSLKLWKQSMALKKQLRHNWNHQPAQKPAGDPPQAPWCQQVFMKAEDFSLGNEDFYNPNLNSVKKQNIVKAIFMNMTVRFHTVQVNIHGACECGHLSITLQECNIVFPGQQNKVSAAVSWAWNLLRQKTRRHLPSSSW